MTGDPSTRHRTLRLPHWGWLLTGALCVLTVGTVWFVVLPAYRILRLFDEIAPINIMDDPLEIDRPKWLSWLRPRKPWFIPFFDKPRAVSMFAYVPSDDDLRALRPLFDLENFRNLDCSELSDAGLGEMARFRNLRRLSISSGTPAPKQAYQWFDKLQRLEHLVLDGQGIDDGLIEALEVSSSLESLDISGTSISGRGFARLASLRKLKKVVVGDSPLDDTGFKELTRISSIESLRIFSWEMTYDGLSAMKALPGLKVVSIHLGDQIVNPLPFLSESVQLEDFSMATTVSSAHRPQTDQDFLRLALQHELRSVDLANTRITDSTVVLLSKLPKLEYVSLHDTDITDASIPILMEMTNLKGIHVDSSNFAAIPGQQRMTAKAYDKFISDMLKRNPDIFKYRSPD
jgi:Leucine-rich repeat (LRR) protein